MAMILDADGGREGSLDEDSLLDQKSLQNGA